MAYKFQHLNKRESDILYPKIARQQGGLFCNHCGATKDSLIANKRSPKFVIDRIDRNIGYWIQDRKTGDTKPNMANLQLACKGCNLRKEFEIPPGMDTPPERELTGEMLVNRTKEPFYRKWVHGLVDIEGKLEWDEAIDSGAEFVGISPTTARRYLKKMISKSGDYYLGPGKNGGTYIYEKKSKSDLKRETDQQVELLKD